MGAKGVTSIVGSTIRLCRQPFLEAILKEANQNRRQEMLEHAPDHCG